MRPQDPSALAQKVQCLTAPQLRDLAGLVSVAPSAPTSSLRSLLEQVVSSEQLDAYIRAEYRRRVQQRQAQISDEDLRAELAKVTTYEWGVVQGQLDQKIQTEYVRRYARHGELMQAVQTRLHGEVSSYVQCTWYNHWTTILIEEHIGIHPRVVPTLKPVKGIDLFFRDHPFDLKVTYLPRNYDPQDALRNPKGLATCMYENQGAQRFGSDNRMFIVLLDSRDTAESWRLKREFGLVFGRIDDFLDHEDVSETDRVDFRFGGNQYSALSKVLVIHK